MTQQIGVINEIGDMGLGFDVLNEQDQKRFEQQQKKQKQERNNNKNRSSR